MFSCLFRRTVWSVGLCPVLCLYLYILLAMLLFCKPAFSNGSNFNMQLTGEGVEKVSGMVIRYIYVYIYRHRRTGFYF